MMENDTIYSGTINGDNWAYFMFSVNISTSWIEEYPDFNLYFMLTEPSTVLQTSDSSVANDNSPQNLKYRSLCSILLKTK